MAYWISKSKNDYCRNFGKKLERDKFEGLSAAVPGA